MYCGHCGRAGDGNFCTHCGTRLRGEDPQDGAEHQDAITAAGSLPIDDWRCEHRYEKLVGQASFQARVDRAMANATKPMSAEEFLKASNKLTSSIAGGISADSVGKAIQSFTSSLGIAMERSDSATLNAPIGESIAAVLCTLARASQRIKWVEQLPAGVEIDTILNSDMFSMEGEMKVQVTKLDQGLDQGSHLAVSTKVHGQIFDMGKSSRAIQGFIRAVQQEIARFGP